ncbi:hypothetical protein ACFVFQ_21775 [Streptomyces sp. NPDC057743]|uniref:hypothetical protein n=1 Tax=Streptomyces sp. NPDC057743 TaxID=3346236 RepID=UPI0036BB4AB4
MVVQVKAHVRGGVPVQAHTRSPPGSGRQLTIAAIIVILLWGASQGGVKVKGEAKTPPAYRPTSAAPAHAGGAR